VEFPKNITNIEGDAVVKKLVDLPFGFMQGVGCYNKGIIYIFGGVQYETRDKMTSYNKIHTYALAEGKWKP